MSKPEFHNNRMPVTVLILITTLNIGLLINFLVANIGVIALSLSALQIYLLAGLELFCVIVAYVAGKQRMRTDTTVSF